MKIDGKQIAQEILDELKIKIAKQNLKLHLAIIIVGNDPISLSYIKQKEFKAEEIGIKTTLLKLDEKIKEEELLSVIKKLNNDKDINGIVVQKPLPENINNEKINLSILPQKDIDGFNPSSRFESPIGLSVLEVLREINNDLNTLKNKKMVILGKGETGGKPIKEALLKFGVAPIVIDSKTKNPEEIIKSSDIVISAVGKKEVIKPENLKKGTLLIGAGQHLENSEFYGDYNEEKIKNIVSFYTPTPGGIGPINVAMLLKNLLDSK